MTRFRTPFGFHSTAGEVIGRVDLTGKKAVVTGGAGGIGLATSRALAGVGAAVTLAVRRPEAAESIATELRASTGNSSIDVRSLDLSDLHSVRTFVAEWDGLHRALVQANGARVVSVSSSGHLHSPVIFDDLGFDFIPYTPIGAYGQSKSACALLSVGITRRWANDGIRSNTLHPGAIATGLQKYTGGVKTPPERRKTPEQGASTSVLLATSPLSEGVSGLYFEDCNEAEQVNRRPTDFTGGYAAYAVDAANAERMWSVALSLVGERA